MKLNELKSLIAKVKAENPQYEFFGIRTQDVEFKIGPVEHCSHIWIDGKDTAEELDGISATDCDGNGIVYHADDRFDYKVYCMYPGDHQAILAANTVSGGDDIDELVMMDSVVVHVIR